MNITFRADASTQIGTGHIMRCLTLADALKEQGATCHFICREHEGNLIELIKSKGHAVTALAVSASNTVGAGSSCDQDAPIKTLAHAHWLGATQEQDAEQTITALSRKTHWLIIDHYALDHTWETLLAPHANKILVIDDLADRKHHCHILLDQNLGKTPMHYQHLVPEHCALLLGPQYALLQPQYAELHPRTPPRQGPIKNILIYFGGSDQHDLTGMATHACLKLNRPDIQLNVVMGNSYPHPEKLQQLAHTHSNITLHQNLPSLAPLMLQADLAIGAGGGATYERLYMRLPSLLIPAADNQVQPLLNIQKLGYIDLFFNQKELKNKLNNILKSGVTPPPAVVECGVSKILEIFFSEQIRLKIVSKYDIRRTYYWLQDSELRKQFMAREKPLLSNHFKYWRSVIMDTNSHTFSVYFKGKHIGNAGIKNIYNETGELWLYIGDKVNRNKGLGRLILNKIEFFMKYEAGLKKACLHVSKENYTAIKLYESFKYREVAINYKLSEFDSAKALHMEKVL